MKTNQNFTKSWKLIRALEQRRSDLSLFLPLFLQFSKKNEPFCPANILTFRKWCQSNCRASRDLTILISEYTIHFSLSPLSLPVCALSAVQRLVIYINARMNKNAGTGGAGQTNNSPFCIWQLAPHQVNVWLKSPVRLDARPQKSDGGINSLEREKEEVQWECVRLESVAVSHSQQETWLRATLQIWGVPGGSSLSIAPPCSSFRASKHNHWERRPEQGAHVLKMEKQLILIYFLSSNHNEWTRLLLL